MKTDLTLLIALLLAPLAALPAAADDASARRQLGSLRTAIEDLAVSFVTDLVSSTLRYPDGSPMDSWIAVMGVIGRMHSGLCEHFAQTGQFLSIQTQTVHRCPALRSQADHDCSLLVPNEMVGPSVLTGMKKRLRFLSDQVPPCRGDMFVAIAARAGETQVFGNRIAPCRLRDDVFDDERVGGESPPRQAILAATPRPGDDQSLQYGTGPARGHRAVRCRVGP